MAARAGVKRVLHDDTSPKNSIALSKELWHTTSKNLGCMRKTSQQDLTSQPHRSRPFRYFLHNEPQNCGMPLFTIMVVSSVLLAALFEGALYLRPLAHAVPLKDGDFAQIDSLLPLPKISELPEVSELPRVSVTKFTARGKNGGRWRGRVFGSGPTALILRFFKGDTLVKKQLIGRVHLDSEPQGVRFSYSGTRPRTGTTHWDIIALYDKSR
jgi:hypothetical protein